jgi:hypothetical protein
MAHYALMQNSTNIVVLVHVGRDENDEGKTTEFWENHYSAEGYYCKRTSYNTLGGSHASGGLPFRKNYAGIGYTYDSLRDAFIPPKPFESWVLNEDTCLWDAPVSYPDDGQLYFWDEASVSWVLAPESEEPPA